MEAHNGDRMKRVVVDHYGGSEVLQAHLEPELDIVTYFPRAASLSAVDAASAAILCKPVSVAQTRAAAVDRVRMPQKTTFFWPKPRTGMVFRPFD